MNKIIFLYLFVFAFLVSCSSVASSKNKLGNSQPSIATSKWILSETVKGNTPTLNIENNKISGNAGCNNYFSDITLASDSGSFVAGNIGSTKKACENMSVENNFLQMLSSANKYVVNGTNLELYKDGLLLLKFNKVE